MKIKNMSLKNTPITILILLLTFAATAVYAENTILKWQSDQYPKLKNDIAQQKEPFKSVEPKTTEKTYAWQIGDFEKLKNQTEVSSLGEQFKVMENIKTIEGVLDWQLKDFGKLTKEANFTEVNFKDYKK